MVRILQIPVPVSDWVKGPDLHVALSSCIAPEEKMGLS